jgi:hypothetical protein
MSRNSSILGIDFGYAVATLGVIATSVTMIVGEKTELLSHVDYFVLLDFFPALFFFLNGTTVALSMRDKRVSRRRLLSYLGKRGSVLMLTGLIFIGQWPMNLFFLSGIFFIVSPFLSQWSNLVLRMGMVILTLLGVWLINSDVHTYPLYSGFQLQGSGVKELLSWVLFNGYYSFLPYSVFFVSGMIFGRGDMRPRGWIPPSSLLAVVLIAGGIVLQRYANTIVNPEEIEIVPQPFPLNIKLLFPAFVLVMLGATWLFMNLSVYGFRKGAPEWFKGFIQMVSGGKYSIYLFQLLLGAIVLSIFNLIIFKEKIVLAGFVFVLMAFCMWFLRLWKNKLDETPPMESIIKRISGSAKKS